MASICTAFCLIFPAFFRWLACCYNRNAVCIVYRCLLLLYVWMCSFESEGAFFRPWRDIVPSFEFAPGMLMHHIVVPTVDTARFSFVTRRLLSERRPVYLTGVSGTGKTILLTNLLQSMAQEQSAGGDNVYSMTINFSARTSSAVTQATIENKLIRKHADLLGPPPGKQVWLVHSLSRREA